MSESFAAYSPMCEMPADPATVIAMAKAFGEVYSDTPGDGKAVRHRIYLGRRDGKRVFIGHQRDPFDPTKRIRFESREEAERFLTLIRARLLSGVTVPELMAALVPTAGDVQTVEVWAERYLKMWRGLVRKGDKSPTSIREIERWAKKDGHWGFWWGRDVRSLRNGHVVEWHEWLSDRRKHPDDPERLDCIGPKTQKNISDGFKTMLLWSASSGATGSGQAWPIPKFPVITTPRPSTPTLPVERVLNILAELEPEDRGIYLAIGFESVRFGTACATLLEDYRPEAFEIHWHRGRQGQRLDSPVRTQKNRSDQWREIWAPELRTWLEWRLDQVTNEDRITGKRQALFWHLDAWNEDKTWNYTSFSRKWHAAAERAGEAIAPQAGTRHSVISALAGVLTPHALQAHTQHASLQSLAHYTTGAKPDHAAMVKALGVKK